MLLQESLRPIQIVIVESNKMSLEKALHRLCFFLSALLVVAAVYFSAQGDFFAFIFWLALGSMGIFAAWKKIIFFYQLIFLAGLLLSLGFFAEYFYPSPESGDGYVPARIALFGFFFFLMSMLMLLASILELQKKKRSQ